MRITFDRHSTMKFALGISLLIPVLIPLSFLGERTSMTAHRAGPEVDSAARLAPIPALNQPAPAAQTRMNEAYGRLPLRFEANRGQTDRQVDFLSRGSGYSLFLTPSEAVFTLRNTNAVLHDQPVAAGIRPGHPKADIPAPKSTVLRMKLARANPAPEVVGLDQLPTKSHYFLGNDPAAWRTNVANYSKVQYRGVYPGIDLIYYGNQRQLEYDFTVAPGANPDSITLEFEGAEKMEINARGDLVLHTASGPIRQHKPFVYQEVDGVKQELGGGYVLKDEHRVGFQVNAYDAARPLVIDPVLVYSTYLGGRSGDQGLGIAVDTDGNTYVTGVTASTDFPTANAQQPANGGSDDAFVAKLNADGSALLYSTYLGGSRSDEAIGIALDGSGNAYIAGVTDSSDFPTENPLQPAISGSSDAFVAKLSTDGSALLYSTYLGGSGGEGTFIGGVGIGITADADGNAYVRGDTTSPDFPTTPGAFQMRFAGRHDAFVTKLDPAGTTLIYSTYLGGSDDEFGLGIAVDWAGNAYATGFTYSSDFPTTPGALQTSFAGAEDIFVTKLNATGTALAYSTFLGGRSHERCFGIAVDAGGNAYLAGVTDSPDFPIANALQPTLGGTVSLRSTDGGSSWDAINAGLTSSIAFSLAIDPMTTSTLYAGTIDGTFKSTDGGNGWRAINTGLTNTIVRTLAIDPTTPTTLYAGTAGGVFKSTDGGSAWSAINAGLTNTQVQALAIDPATPSTLYAGTADGIFKSADGGSSWGAINTGLTSSDVRAVVIDPITPSTLYAGTDGGVFKSTDGGDNWSITRLRNRPVLSLAIDPSAPSTLYAGTDGRGTFKSTDGGNRWSLISDLVLPVSDRVNALAIDPSTPSTLYAGSGGVFKSIDGGGEWSATGLTRRVTVSLAIDPVTPSTLYAGTFLGIDACVTKLNADGSELVYSTYLGGGNDELGLAIAVDAEGSAAVTGWTSSLDFPTANPLQPVFGGGDIDILVTKFNADGSELVYSTYLGGGGIDLGNAIALDADGNAHVTGGTGSFDFPTANSLQPLFGGGSDAFIIKIADQGADGQPSAGAAASRSPRP